MSAIKTDTRLCKMYKEGERLNACCIQSKVAKTTITGKLVTIRYNFWCPILTIFDSSVNGCHSNWAPILNKDQHNASVLPLFLRSIFSTHTCPYPPWCLPCLPPLVPSPLVIKSASFHLAVGGGHCVFASPCCYFHPPLCFLPSFPCLTSWNSRIYQLHLP